MQFNKIIYLMKIKKIKKINTKNWQSSAKKSNKTK